MTRRIPWAALAVLLVSLPAIAVEPKLEIKTGDHICIIGNTLAERMQHDGYLEAMLHQRFPDFKLVIRNLGFSGDTITTRLRSMDFGTPDQWLSGNAPVPQPGKLSPAAAVPANRFENVGTKADVIFAFFGYNESWAGEEGLPQFKKELGEWIDHTLAQKYNGKSAPRLVLFGPTPIENLMSPDAPNPQLANGNIAMYNSAMRDLAKAKGVPFVDLFTPLTFADRSSRAKLTINGLHLSEAGNAELASLIGLSLFGPPSGTLPDAAPLLQVIRNKNFYWWNRYRAVDGYSTFGDRAFLKFTDGQTNYEVVQRELQVIDQLVAERDALIWDAAQGKKVDVTTPLKDHKLLSFVPVVTNKPGAGPNGTHLFLGGEDAIKQMTPGKNLKVNLFADEAMFPEMANPVQMQFDSKGRLWVAVWPTYPHWKPTEEMNDKLLILEDTDGDGKADRCSTFADGLHNPTGFEFVPGGVLIAQCPDIMLLKDTNGDGKCDRRERVLHGLDTADTHHSANSFAVDPTGAVYFQEGTFHHTQVETPYGPVRRNVNAGVYRYEPRTQKFDVYVTYGFANPHGHAFDYWGRDIVIDGTGAVPYDAALFSGHLDYPNKHSKPMQVYQQRTRPCGGLEFLSSQAFPDDYRDNLIVTNVIGVLGLLRYKITQDGGVLKGQELEPLVTSTDQNFRPVDVKTGPDGAVYFIDWQNPIIGHMQHNLRDPSRDRQHGRVYRITYDNKTVASPKIAGEPILALLEVLKHPDNRVRARARLELAERPVAEVMPALQKWITTQPDTDDHAFLEALWLTQSFNQIDGELLARVLASGDERARASAVRILALWRERIPDALGVLRKLAADPSARVRTEAVRAASFFERPEAVEVVLIASEQPADKGVAFISTETLKALNPLVAKAARSGQDIAFATPAGRAFFLKSVETPDLVKMKRTPEVARELLTRAGVLDDLRRLAADDIAAATQRPAWQVVAEALQAQDKVGADESVTYDLTRLLAARPAELPAARPVLEALATSAKSDTLRRLAYAGLVAADGSPQPAWALAQKSPARVADFAAAISAIRDPNQRAAAYPIAREILSRPLDPAKKVVTGRYVRLELPGNKRTLTLAEVEVLSGGQNIALGKPCRQSTTGNGGVASRAVDGNKSGVWLDGGQTHTQEAQPNTFWEVDLNGLFPIEAILVYTRTDSTFNTRLDNYKLIVFDANRKTVFAKANNKSPEIVGRVEVAPQDVASVARARAMLALTTVRGKEAEAVNWLAGLLGTPERASAVAALQRIPVAAWPKEVAPAVVNRLTAYVAGVPEAEKTFPATLDAMQLADAATTLLPREVAKQARKALGEVGVRVVRVGTITDQMRYDRDRLVVQAGKPVEFVFANTDLMPHNFVITKMGALVEVGEAAEAFGVTKSAPAANYIPPSDKVLLGSKLLQPGTAQSLRFTAPTEPGVYPYVCTYPGHWRRMYGALYVVNNIDDYLENPTAYIAQNPVPIADDMLKFNKPRTEWTIGDLVPAVAAMGPRPYANGRQLFTVGTCISCHQFGGQGQNFGPDLTKLDLSIFKKPEDVLRHILEPSLRIEDQYRNFRFNLADGATVTGMVLEKTATGDYKVIENPLAKAEARLILAKDLDDQPKPSAVSIMPKGLLDQFTKDEILDLVAYVWGAADPKRPVFGGGHDHHHGH